MLGCGRVLVNALQSSRDTGLVQCKRQTCGDGISQNAARLEMGVL